MKEFVERLGKAARNLWNWFKGLPIVKPLWALVYSRKSLITAALVAFALQVVPQLAPEKEAVAVLAAQVVLIALAAVAQSLGIAIEDSASKGAGTLNG